MSERRFTRGFTQPHFGRGATERFWEGKAGSTTMIGQNRDVWTHSRFIRISDQSVWIRSPCTRGWLCGKLEDLIRRSGRILDPWLGSR